jgi:GxxExxY protein
MMNERELNRISGEIVDSAIRVHSVLGNGAFESAYEACLAYELRKRGHKVLTQVLMPLIYDGVRLDRGYRIDMLVDDAVMVENKTVETLISKFFSQLRSYLKLGNRRLGLLINWHEEHLKDGIRRVVNGL